MKSTHRLHADIPNGDSIRIDRTEHGKIALTIDQPRELELRKRTMVFINEETLRALGSVALAFINSEEDFALEEDLPVEF